MALTRINAKFKCPKCRFEGEIVTATHLSCIKDIRYPLMWECPICSEEILPKDAKCVILSELKNFMDGLY
jgi:predicted RNA-binding Zn-ribbon protein involved in translation (DUF1610 family)